MSARELRAEIDIACDKNPELDYWVLVASREVTTQEDEALAAVCDERGIAYLSLGTAEFANVGLLDALCASYEDATVAFLVSAGYAALVQDFREAAHEIKSKAQYRPACQHLKEALELADIGFGSFARRLNARFLEDVADKVTCRKRFRCALTPSSLHVSVPPIRRVAVLNQLQAAWNATQSREASSTLLVLGEEGTGKSWVVTDWLCDLAKADDAPAIFYVPAVEPKSNEAATVLEAHARQFALTRSTESSAQRKLQRWLGRGPSATARRAIVVLDGINERPAANLWADLIEEFSSSRMSSVSLVVTCRSLTWQERFRTKLKCQFDTVTVGDFTEPEFTQRIAMLPAEKRQAIRSAGVLVRRPRYFHLAIQRVHDLNAGEELTAEILYYWDWQHRELLRRDLPVDSQEFSEVISHLARDERAGQHLDRAKLEAVLGAERFIERQGELASSSVIERTAAGWRLKRDYFALGLGMYLAARLEECGGDIESRCAAADELLGDTTALDLTTSVLQHALLHTLLSTHQYDRQTQIALLSIWASALNATDALGEALPNLPMTPGLLLDFAEHHWQQDTNSHVMEQAVLAAIIRVMRVSEHHAECVSRLTVWASFVHEHGESEASPGREPSRVHEDVIRLCGAVAEFTLPVSAISIRRATEQSAVKLGRLALAAVSAASVRQYWSVVETSFVADQAMDGPRTELLAWLIRWCHEPLDDLVDRSTEMLLADALPVSYRSAQRLISILGCQALLPRLLQISAEHFPVKRWLDVEEDADPCRSFFRAPTVSELPTCLGRADVPLHLKLDRGRSFAADLDFHFPFFFEEQVAQAIESIDASKLYLYMGQTDVDHTLGQLLPLGLRLALPALADLICRLAHDCAARSGMPLRQASFAIEEFNAFLDDPAIAAVRIAWERISQGAVPNLTDADFVEYLFAKSLLSHMDTPEQLDFLRRRGGAAHFSHRMAAQLKQIEPEQQTILRAWTNDSELLRLALSVMNVQREIEPTTAALLIESALPGEDSADRGQALKLALRLPEHAGSRLLRFHSRPLEEQTTPFERYFRTISAVLHEKPDEASVRCVSAEYLGQALAVAPTESATLWAPVFGELLFTAAQKVLSGGEFPLAPVEVDSGSSDAPWCRLGQPRSSSAHNIMFSPMSTWGGVAEGSAKNLFGGNEGDHDAGRDALEEALDRASAAGNWLYGAYIPAESIGLLATSVPDTAAQLEQIFNAAIGQRKLYLVQAVVEAAIEWGFSVSHPAVFDWYDEVESTQPFARYTDKSTGLLRRYAALASAKPSTEAQKRWRTLIDAQTDDLALHRVLSALAAYNSSWLLDEASRELASGSPRGRALALVMSSTLGDPDKTLASMQAQVCGEHQSWYDSLAEMAWQYVHRGRDQKRWLNEALLLNDPIARIRAAALCEYLGHPTLAREIDRALSSDECAGIDGARVLQLPTRNGHSRERSEWAKNMSKRLLGSRVLEHAVSPWLPSGIT